MVPKGVPKIKDPARASKKASASPSCLADIGVHTESQAHGGSPWPLFASRKGGQSPPGSRDQASRRMTGSTDSWAAQEFQLQEVTGKVGVGLRG